MALDLLSNSAATHPMRVRPAVQEALRDPRRRLSPELQALSDSYSAGDRLWAIRGWLVIVTALDVVMLRGDVLSGPAAFQIGTVMRTEINLPLAIILFFTLPRIPDRARAILFAAFCLLVLATICIQAHYALPVFAAHHIIAAGLMIGTYNLIVPETARRAMWFTATAVVLFAALILAPLGPYRAVPPDLIGLVLLVAGATLQARYSLDGAARAAFLLRLQDGMTTQEVLFANQLLVDLSNTDPLTRLANRRCFDEKLGAAGLLNPDLKRPVGLLMIDVDYFKCYNDNYGHPAGDLCLRNVANAMSRELRGGQDLIARYGGEEFAVLLPGLDLNEVQNVGERLCARIEALALPHGKRPDGMGRVTVSIGAITSSQTGDFADSLIKEADLALYEAKRLGRNQLCSGAASLAVYAEAPRPHAVGVAALSQSASLAEDLRGAMLGGHLHISYQPIYETRSGEIVAFEALLRWTHPHRGSISPKIFIPAAEESGMIVPVGKWVLREACAEAASWPAPRAVAVNISPVQFSDPGIVQTIATILKDTGLSPDRLLLEITEGLQLVVSEGVAVTLQSLRALGVKIALDDFGTGYANLSRLRDLPFDVIKIDRSFLQSSGGGHLTDILTPLVAFARAYGPKIVMEGVETAEHLALVKALDCDWVQGFYLSQPLQPDAARALLRTRALMPDWMLLPH